MLRQIGILLFLLLFNVPVEQSRAAAPLHSHPLPDQSGPALTAPKYSTTADNLQRTLDRASFKGLAPAFDRNELRPWDVIEAQLSTGTESRRPPSIWQEYFWRIVLVSLALVLQTALIVALIYEDRRRRQAEASAMELRSELAHADRVTTAGVLLASIVHEVRQPLTAMIANGNAAMRWLGRTPPDLEETRQAIKRIVEDGHRAGDLIDGMRQAFRGGGSSKERVDVNEIIARVIMLSRNELRRHHIELMMDLEKGTPPYVSGVEVQLQQVIYNLVTNAVEAMSAVTDRAHSLRIASRVEAARQVVINVEDSGPGIDAETADQLFKPFFTTKQHGMGMGLSVCRSIIEAHEGQLTVLSGVPNKGSFRIAMPYAGA